MFFSTDLETNMDPRLRAEATALTCWKDIAHYLGKGVRTVQRWEQSFGLPVRRLNGIDHKSAIVAYPRDLDAWLESRWSQRKPVNHTFSNGSRPMANLGDLVQHSRELRAAHVVLIHENSTALAALVHSCKELEITKRRMF